MIKKICNYCKSEFQLKVKKKWNKSIPINFRFKEDGWGNEEYYHSRCWEIIEKAKIQKTKISVGIENFIPKIAMEREIEE